MANFISAKVSNPTLYGAKSWSFLEVLVKGKMWFYVINQYSSYQGETIVITVYYAKLTGDKDYTTVAMNWRKRLLKLDPYCDEFADEVKSAVFVEEQLIKLVEFYNENCID